MTGGLTSKVTVATLMGRYEIGLAFTTNSNRSARCFGQKAQSSMSIWAVEGSNPQSEYSSAYKQIRSRGDHQSKLESPNQQYKAAAIEAQNLVDILADG